MDVLRDFAALQMLIFRAVGLANPTEQDFCLRFLNRTNDPYTRKALSDHVDNEDREDGVTIRDAIGRWVLYSDELDKYLEVNRRNSVPMTAEEQNEAILDSHRRKPVKSDWRKEHDC